MSNNPFDQPQQPFPYVFQQAPQQLQPVPAAMYYPASANNDGTLSAPMPHQYATQQPHLMPLQQPVPTGFPNTNNGMFYAQQPPQYGVPQQYDNMPLVHQQPQFQASVAPVVVEQQPATVADTQQAQPRITPAQPVSFVRVLVVLAVVAIAFAVFSIGIPLIFIRRSDPYTPTPSPTTTCFYSPKGNRETVFSIYDTDNINSIDIQGIAEVEISEAYTGSAITVTLKAASLELNDYAAVEFKTTKFNGTFTVNSKFARTPKDCTWARISIKVPTKFLFAANMSLNIFVDRNATVTPYGKTVAVYGPYEPRFNFSSVTINSQNAELQYLNIDKLVVNATAVSIYNSNVTNIAANLTYSIYLYSINATNVAINATRVDSYNSRIHKAVYNVSESASMQFQSYSTPLFVGLLDFVLKGELATYQSNFTRINLPVGYPLNIKETTLKRYTAVVGAVDPAATVDTMDSISVTVSPTKASAPQVTFSNIKNNKRKQQRAVFVK